MKDKKNQEKQWNGKEGKIGKKSKIRVLAAVMLGMSVLLAGCRGTASAGTETDGEFSGSVVSGVAASGSASPAAEPVELTVLAAASLTDVCNEIKTLYEQEHPEVTLLFSYGGSGALQSQIEEGAPADLFISAAAKQMTALDEQGLMDSDTIVTLLENKVVLIVPKDSKLDIASFEDVTKAEITMIGLGEPGSVPVGQYAEEIFTYLGTLEEIKDKANYGTDVRTVLAWVETGAVDCGVVYATDAYTSELVKIVCEAPEGSCRQVLYPAGIVGDSENQEAAQEFLNYLQSEEIMELFGSYGFTPVN